MGDKKQYAGETKFFHKADNFTRIWHIWVDYDDEGTLTAITFGISNDIGYASGHIGKIKCKTPLHNYLWSLAVQRLREHLEYDSEEDDESVIIPFDSESLENVPDARSKVICLFKKKDYH